MHPLSRGSASSRWAPGLLHIYVHRSARAASDGAEVGGGSGHAGYLYNGPGDTRDQSPAGDRPPQSAHGVHHETGE